MYYYPILSYPISQDHTNLTFIRSGKSVVQLLKMRCFIIIILVVSLALLVALALQCSKIVLVFLSRGLYCHYKISPRDSYTVTQLVSASFYRSQSREMVTMLGEYLESVRKLKRSCSCVTISR